MTNRIMQGLREYFLGTDTLKKLEEEREFWYINCQVSRDYCDDEDEEDKSRVNFLSELQKDMYKTTAVFLPNILFGLAIAGSITDVRYLKVLAISEGTRLGTKGLYSLASAFEKKQRKELLMCKDKIKKLEEERSKRGGYSW